MKKEILPKKAKIESVQVRFLYSDSGFCQDFFRTEKELRLCRIETQRGGEYYPGWYTVTDEDEPCSPVKRGLPIHILDVEGKTVVTEQNSFVNGDFLAEKRFPFSWECHYIKDEAILSLIEKIY